jgi:hypothetical protein
VYRKARNGSRERRDVGTPHRVTGLISGQVRHGALPRGLTSTVRSRLHEGSFGRMFRFLEPATFGANETENEATLRKLGEAMVAVPHPEPVPHPDPIAR